ncbi:MAG: HD domain-containing protein [Candidatus Korarchaeota archaeon]|nr:HD domain-containing protein [Candidatus Korarchaeota archaeon]
MDSIESIFHHFVRRAYESGWHLVEAKYGKGGAQSLLAHSLNVMSVCLRLGKILNWPEDRLKLIVASRALHDIGKVRWKKGEPPPKAMTSEELKFARKFLREIGLNEEEIDEVISLAQKDEAPHGVMEFRSLSSRVPISLDDLDLGRIADAIASLKDPTDSLSSSEMERLRRLGLSLAVHKVSVVRGISTQLLHSAMERLYREAGFEPILYFHSGTLYAGKGDPPKFTKEMVVKALKEEVSKYIGNFSDKAAAAAVGSVNRSPIKLPEFIFASEEAGVSFVREVLDRVRERTKVTEKELKGEGFGEFIRKDLELGVKESSIKLYKGLKYFLTYMNQLLSVSRKFKVESPESIMKALFREHFGCDPPEGLQDVVFQTPNEKAKCVIDKLLGILGVEKLSLDDALDKIGPFAEDLARNLVREARGASLGEEVLLEDIIHPPLSDPMSITEKNFKAYLEGKKRPHTPVCPICGRPAEEVGKAELHGDGVQAFNNLLRGGSSLSTSNKVKFCKACDLEAKLRALLLDGWQDGEVLFLVPMVNSTPDLLHLLWESSIDVMTKMRGVANIFNDHLWSRIVLEDGLLAASEIWKALSREMRYLERGRIWKEAVRRVEACLKELYDDPQQASSYLDVQGDDFRQIAEALVDTGKIPEDCIEWRGDSAVFMRAGNYVIVITRQRIGLRDESEVGKDLRRLFFAVLFGILFQAMVTFSPIPLSVLSVDLRAGGYAEVPKDIGLHDIMDRLGLRGKWVDIPSSGIILRRLASLIAASYEAYNLYGKDNLLIMAKTYPGRVLARLIAEGGWPSARIFEYLSEYWGVI